MMSLFLMLPPLFWGVAAYTAPRKDPEVTTLMHDLATLTLTTTDQYYIFVWVAVTVIALRPPTQLVKNNRSLAGWRYLSLWITIMFEAGAVAFVLRSGPFAWNGLLVFWCSISPAVVPTLNLLSRRGRKGTPAQSLTAVKALATVHGGNGVTYEYQLAPYFWVVRMLNMGPVSKEMILNFVAEHSLGLPRSY
jgi:hypothetical protein